MTVRHISGESLTQGPVAATAHALTAQHTIIKQQALAGKQSTIVGGQQVALRQAVGVQPSQQQLAAAIVRQHGISVQQPQTVTVHQSPGGATTRSVSIAVQQGLRPGVTVRQAVAAPSVVSVQQSAVRLSPSRSLRRPRYNRRRLRHSSATKCPAPASRQ